VIQYEALRLIHRHGDEGSPMEPKDRGGPAETDIERSILRGGRIFRCTTCDEEIEVSLEEPREADAEPR
jgi:hypothetical protein